MSDTTELFDGLPEWEPKKSSKVLALDGSANLLTSDPVSLDAIVHGVRWSTIVVSCRFLCMTGMFVQ